MGLGPEWRKRKKYEGAESGSSLNPTQVLVGITLPILLQHPYRQLLLIEILRFYAALFVNKQIEGGFQTWSCVALKRKGTMNRPFGVRRRGLQR